MKIKIEERHVLAFFDALKEIGFNFQVDVESCVFDIPTDETTEFEELLIKAIADSVYEDFEAAHGNYDKACLSFLKLWNVDLFLRTYDVIGKNFRCA